MFKLIRGMRRAARRAGNFLTSLLLFPLFLPLFVREGGRAKRLGVWLMLPNTVVYLYLYLYLARVVLWAVGASDETVGILSPLIIDPRQYLDTLFFWCYFPVMGFYVYVNQAEQWDGAAIREHFAEPVPTEEEIRKAQEAKQREKARRKRMFRWFRVRFGWTFLALFGLLGFLSIGSDSPEASWGWIVAHSALCAAILAFAFTLRKEEKRKRSARRKGIQPEP